MKKVTLALAFIFVLLIVNSYKSRLIKADDKEIRTQKTSNTEEDENISSLLKNYKYPEFYRGIYLNVESGKNFGKIKRLVDLAGKSYINTFVLDVQCSRYRKAMVPAEHVLYCLKNRIHPVARIVMFPDGLKDYPVSKAFIQDRLDIAAEACKNGFREIQFDYIRFNDSSRLRHLSLKDRYAFIEGFLQNAREYLKKYNVKIAADIFGRIPLNASDLIGQRMEGLDLVVDVICPMAYPSHYTWDRKLQEDPYYTVFITSKKANERTKQADIVTYIQAFKMRLGQNSFPDYIAAQIKAVHDSGVKGFILWNARQEYDIPLVVTRNFYSNKVSKESGKNEIRAY